MAVVRLDTFGGERPSLDKRLLPPNDLQRAVNLLPGVPEFRPLGADVVAVSDSGVSNPRTIYRLARLPGGSFSTNMTTGWLTHADVVNYVKGQLNDDATERTYYTLPGAPPRALDNTGKDRRLGVPRPSVPPGINVVENYQYTAEEKAKDLTGAATDIKSVIKASVYEGWVGTPTSTPGADNSFLTTGSDKSLIARTYALSNGAVTDSFTALPADKFSWVFDPSLGGYTNNGRRVIPYYGYARTYVLNRQGLVDGLKAIKRATASNEALLSSTAVESIIAAVESAFKSGSSVKALLEKHASARNETESYLAMSGDLSLSEAVRAFYAKPETQATITQILTNFGADLFARARTVATNSEAWQGDAA